MSSRVDFHLKPNRSVIIIEYRNFPVKTLGALMINCNLFVEIIAELKRLSEQNEETKKEMKSLIDENISLRERILILEEGRRYENEKFIETLNKEMLEEIFKNKFLSFIQANDIPNQDMVKDLIDSEIEDYDYSRHSAFRSFEYKIEEIESQLSDIQDIVGELDADEISNEVIKEIKSRL